VLEYRLNGSGRAGRLEGEGFARFLDLLTALEGVTRLVEQHGIPFPEYLKLRGGPAGNQFPLYRVLHTDRQVKTHQLFFYDEREYDEFVNSLQEQLKAFGEELEIIEVDDYEGLARARGAPNTLRPRKFHQAPRSAQLVSEIEGYGIPLDSLVPPPGEEQPSVKFSIISNGEIVNVDALREVVPAVKQLGRKGLEIERFKGLGEMDAAELAETTLQPGSRTMVQVTVGDAIKADRYFSILAGKDVKKRREFIEMHALEAHNLDV